MISIVAAASAPFLPLHTAVKYVAGAYAVFILVLIVYVAIMATRLARDHREVLELRARLEEREAAAPDPELSQLSVGGGQGAEGTEFH
jgi:hypothetical protein